MVARIHGSVSSFWFALIVASLVAGCEKMPEQPSLAESFNDEMGGSYRDAGAGLRAPDPLPNGNHAADDAEEGEDDAPGYVVPGAPTREDDDDDAPGEGGEDDDAPEDGADGDEDGAVCGTLSARAHASLRPVDIIWVIDSSPSMDDEIAIIQDNLNDFTARIGASGLDYRVVLIAAEEFTPTNGRDYFGVCIPPPLSGAAGCPDTDSDRYLHVREGVHSADALSKLLSTRNQYEHFLRPGAGLHIVVVSDDDQGRGARTEDFFAAGFGDSVYFHSIVDEVGRPAGCGPFGDPCSCGEARGQTYIDLSEETGGVVVSVCSEDWAPIFGSLEERVRSGNEIPCTFVIPTPVGAIIDFDRVNVDFVGEDGARTPLVYADDCAEHPNSWHYDNPQAPVAIELCPAACGAIEGDVEVEFGCDMRKQ